MILRNLNINLQKQEHLLDETSTLSPVAFLQVKGFFSPSAIATVLRGSCDIPATKALYKPHNRPNVERHVIHVQFFPIPVQIMKLVSLESISQLKPRRPQPTTTLSKHRQVFFSPSICFPPLPLGPTSVYAVAQASVIYRRKMLYKHQNMRSFKLFSA